MLSLGGQVIGFAGAEMSSASKGETVADTSRVVSCYADIIAMRHPKEGAPLVASMYSSIPVINAGDGGHNHPTQTLIDLMTIRQLLSWGFFKNSLTFAPFADTPAIYTIYESLLSHAAYTYRSPELMFYMILELVSGTSYNAILYQQPVPLEELKPELYAAICGIFKQFRIRKKRKNAENAGADPASLFS